MQTAEPAAHQPHPGQVPVPDSLSQSSNIKNIPQRLYTPHWCAAGNGKLLYSQESFKMGSLGWQSDFLISAGENLMHG